MTKVSQIDLVACITQHLEQRGCSLMPRHVNAVADMANYIIAELDRQPHMATEAMTIDEWFAGDDTGASSKFMARKLSGRPTGRGAHYPLDPDDFGRCFRLLEYCPGLREKFSEMADAGPVWKRYVKAWSELESLWKEESPSGRCTKLYRRMLEIQESVIATA